MLIIRIFLKYNPTSAGSLENDFNKLDSPVVAEAVADKHKDCIGDGMGIVRKEGEGDGNRGE